MMQDVGVVWVSVGAGVGLLCRPGYVLDLVVERRVEMWETAMTYSRSSLVLWAVSNRPLVGQCSPWTALSRPP